jgi:hypothetical protein
MRLPLLLLITSFATAACNRDSIVGPVSPARPTLTASAAAAAAPDITTSPFSLEFDDVNPCTGLLEHFDFEGTVRVLTFDDHTVVHIAGTVATSDGWVGKFNRQFVFQANETTARFLDMEVGPTHARQLFRAVFHITVINGEVVTEFLNASLRCIGKPLA